MLSKETRVQAAAVVAAAVLWSLAGVGAGGPVLSDPFAVALGLGTYFLVLAGSHLYLALRGEPGSLGVAARWRFVGATAAVLTLLGAALLAPNGTFPLDVGLVAAAGVVAVGWFVLAARDGYEASAG